MKNNYKKTYLDVKGKRKHEKGAFNPPRALVDGGSAF